MTKVTGVITKSIDVSGTITKTEVTGVITFADLPSELTIDRTDITIDNTNISIDQTIK